MERQCQRQDDGQQFGAQYDNKQRLCPTEIGQEAVVILFSGVRHPKIAWFGPSMGYTGRCQNN